MLDLVSERWMLAAIGFAGGVILGIAARLGRFCTLGAIEDLHYAGSSTRMRMWGVALGAAILVVFAAHAAGWVDPADSFYLRMAPDLSAAIFGGLTFGIGMALAGNCGFGALARLGGGDMRSFVIVVVMGLAAMATLSGPLAALRVEVFPPLEAASPPGLAHHLADRLGVPAVAAGIAIGGAILAGSVLGHRDRAVFWGLPVGLAIASGFVGTTWVATHGFEAVTVTSHSFAAPLGESLLFVMLSSGLSPSFGIGSVAGVLAGALAGSAWRGVFRWEACDDPRELHRQLLGAAMMGVGAVIAAGCSVGQGLSAFAVLAVTAPVTLACIWLGGFLGLKLMIEGRAAFFRA
ncbi:YeeE/YedE family protein [Roseivivax isoporae]|uniref:YeeE/YedE family protein n=1 Tax=Roseivivax isoporae LMG 25204 TaxID=1449351 RepID=X7F371_9RHOB|nr:YeeE/YedE family protein [Roseivivax isoporae]ETX27260.1 YeeE/YedE family protein [Roseivivax isoporae LMG 25204]